MKQASLLTALILILSLFLAGCNGLDKNAGRHEDDSTKLTVYTTIFPLEDFAKKIGGDFVKVESIYPPNVDAHSFEPSTKDMVKLANADLFIYTGAGIEGFADKAVKSLKKQEVKIVKAAEEIELLKTKLSHEDAHGHEEEKAHSEEENGHEEEQDHGKEEARSEDDPEHEEVEAHGHGTGDKDPHIWLDPILAIKLANNIKNSLIERLPEQERVFEENFNNLRNRLEELDEEFSVAIEASSSKYLLVSHAAYGYWEERYGIVQIPIAGLSPSHEPTQRGLAKIIEESKEHNIDYVVFEKNVSPKVSEIIQKEIGAESLMLSNLESITDEDINNNEDYFSLMKKNLDTLITALQ
ncbi:metal ABC transporter solute-binding protein, Zn/Mn family [Mesobacillus harenae]|uniref:metal ABC transporter solute-binding protein, Zn/Mn family n=1 Tax=Mesobacillus harenae TaxID=2213203 RepID=UPI00158048FB|nr:zinc ABC transporter substrate-binding protein [Mesobacillus harenae]